MQATASIPIVGHFDIHIDNGERQRLARLARNLLADEPARASTNAFGPNVHAGLGPGPSLFIEDHSWISLYEWAGDAAFSYRALLLAGDHDMVVVEAPRCRAFEAYCRKTLDLGEAEVLVPALARPRDSLATRCANDGRLVGRAAQLARGGGCLNVVPYMGTGGVWMLARRIAERSNVEVRVAAPLPRLTRRINDKLWFARCVADVLGKSALPPTYATYGPSALAARAANLARSHASVAIKLTDSASSAGNIVLDSSSIGSLSLGGLRERLLSALRRAGWRSAFPLMVTAWERAIIASPSVQIWIPPRDQGLPIVEGIFDQTISGREGAFVGAAPTSLSEPWRQRVADDAVRLAFLFQQLNYFGRCSFDAILVGQTASTAELHWIECNGRWGGVSIPMTLVNRLLGDWRRAPFIIAERADLHGTPRDLAAVLEELGDALYRPGGATGGVIVLSPGRIENGTGFEIIVLDRSAEAARQRADTLSTTVFGV